MASSNSNNISVRLSTRRSGEPFSSLVVVDGYCHCFFCDLMTDFEKKGVATPGLKCEPCGVEGIIYRGCWNKKRRCTRYATQWKLMTKMPPPPGRRGTRRSLWKRAAAGLDELELEPWVSLWSNHFGEETTPPLAWMEGNKIKSTAVEELAPGLGEVAEKS